MTLTLQRPADPTPPHPHVQLPSPAGVRSFTVEVDVCHLANPVVAVQRLLAADVRAFARVEGDDQRFEIDVVVPEGASVEEVERWVRWVVHHAGVRGTVTALR